MIHAIIPLIGGVMLSAFFSLLTIVVHSLLILNYAANITFHKSPQGGLTQVVKVTVYPRCPHTHTTTSTFIIPFRWLHEE